MASTEFQPDRLLKRWFAATREDPDRIPARMDWWFGADAARDRWLAEMYDEHCAAAIAGDRPEPVPEPRPWLAEILLADQLPRNLYRGTARAFAGDERALALCLAGHRRSLDQPLTLIERVFFWMPLQHAENIEAQELGVSLYDTLGPADPYRSNLWKGFADHARQHRDVIERFGRFPHRNEVLGRESTPKEEDYLQSGGKRFGQ